MTTQQPITFLEGFRTTLRPFSEEDLPSVARWINDPRVRQFVSAYLPQSLAAEREWIAGQGKDSKNIVLALVTKPEGVLIGSMGLHGINWKDRVATTGALIGERAYWGKGYGTDAKMALLEYAFHELDLYKICSTVVAFNKRSLAYSLHCGYRIEGRRKEHMVKNGRRYDQVELALFRGQWEPIWCRWKKTGSVK